MRKLLAYLLLTACGTSAQQTGTEFTPLRSSGTIPQDLISFYIRSSENNSKGSSSDFIKHNTVEFGNLFASGKILFNDPLSTYTKKVLDTLLKDQPEVRSRVRIYTIRSAVTNAYTTNDGKIFITTGLLARVENEAELAFILSHELIHYLNQHAYEAYVFNRRVDKKRRRVLGADPGFENGLLTKFRHSRDNEFEADKEGLKLFLASEYSTSVIDSVFTMLDRSDLPVEDLPFDRTFFESSFFHLRDETWLDAAKVEAPLLDADFKESKSTHPNSRSRMAQLKPVLETARQGGKEHLFPEQDFNTMRQLARYELSNVCLLDENYEDAIYNSWLLLKQHPGDLYLRKNISKSLYGLLAENAYRMGLYEQNRKRGYISQLAHLIRYSDRDELEKLALIFTWNTFHDHPDDNDLKILLNSFFANIDEKDKAFFYTRAQAENKLKELNKGSGDKDLADKLAEYNRRSCFADLLSNADFTSALQQSQLSKTPYTVNNAALDGKKMFVIPQVYIIDSISGSKKYADPQKVINDYAEKVKELASEKNLTFTFLSTYDLRPGDIDRYNDYATLSDWVTANTEKEKQGYIDWKRMKELGERYDSKYLCLSGIFIYRNSPGGKFRRWLLFTFLLPPGAGIIPGSIQLFTSNYSTYYSTVIYDIESGKVVSRSFDGNYNNPRPQVKKKYFWRTLNPWYEEVVKRKS